MRTCGIRNHPFNHQIIPQTITQISKQNSELTQKEKENLLF